MPMNLVEVALPLPRLWVKTKLYESILINNQVTKKKIKQNTARILEV